jgi:hypothetical protein
VEGGRHSLMESEVLFAPPSFCRDQNIHCHLRKEIRESIITDERQ